MGTTSLEKPDCHTGIIVCMKNQMLDMNWRRNLARFAGFLSLVLGAIVLLGWYLHEPALIQVNPAFVPMQYNTALGFALGGLALLGLAWSRPRIGKITASIVLLIGVLTLIEYSFGVDLHIDQLFMEHYIDLQTSNPGRMAPNTALCFSLTGLTILLAIVFHDRHRITSTTATLGALIISLGVTALAGYVIGVESAYGWGHMTRMAIHTAAGFIILGAGLVAFAWARHQQELPDQALPHWVPQVIGITGLTITFALWQALSAKEQRMVSAMGEDAANFSDEGLLAFGILLTLALAFRARALARAGRWGGGAYASYVTIALGALLAATLYSLLHTNFKSSVKQRFDGAALSHVEAIEHGIDAYLETLYNIRSYFDASAFVKREEFRILVNRNLERNPGIVAIEWIPHVSGQQRDAIEAAARDELNRSFVIRDNLFEGDTTPASPRDRYFPIYYVEPFESFATVLGFDLASRPVYLNKLIKAARNNKPVVSSRMQLMQSENDAYAVFVALPVYNKNIPLNNQLERETGLQGFVMMVIEIGPLVEAILAQNSSAAGLTLTFVDEAAGEDEAVMYRHVSRGLDLGSDNRETDYLDDGLTSTTTLAFADHHWRVSAHAASRGVYPDHDVDNLWLPAVIFLLSLGMAYFWYRIKQADAELAYNRMLMGTVLDHSPAVIYLKDLQGRYLVVNRVWSKVTDVLESRAIGATDHEIFSPEIAAEFSSNDREVARAGKAIQSEEHLPQPDGTVDTYMSYKFPVADNSGKVFAIGGISSDITEIKQRERQFRVLVDTIPGTVYQCRLDEHGTMLFINKEVENLTGYPAADFEGNAVRTFTSVVHPDDAAYVHETVMEAVSTHEPYMAEYRVIHTDGSIRHVYERGLAEYNDEGVAELLDGTIIDVTELKSLQEDLEQARDDADAANQAKSAFLANMSHELRTPMNAILGYSEMLMEEAEDLGQEEFIPDLTKINSAGNHLLTLINDVLDLSKIESGKMETLAEVFDVAELIDQIAGTAQPLMAKNNNQFRIERGDDLGKACQDITKLSQSLLNILSNAAKFTHDGRITLRVERETTDGLDWLSFAVIDTGIGIAAEKLEHVFQEFIQADNSTTRDYGGTGLGLTISKRICQMLGGDMSVDSELEVGSTFTVRLPATLPVAEVSQETPLRHAINAEQSPTDVHRKTAASTILVIDDDAEATELIRRFLEKDGFNVVTALRGDEGLRLAHTVQPAAITLDIMMPDMDGWSVLRALKADPKLRSIPVIMVSMIDDRKRGYSLGAVDYLTKPIDRKLLHKALSRYYRAEGNSSVLLVEDDTKTREIMARTMKKAGWSVSEAGHGQEALNVMESTQPDLILLDLMMPVMDGFDFLAAMRARPQWKDIPVIVITAKDITAKDRDKLSGRVEEIVEKNAYTSEQLLLHVSETVARHNDPG
jgi:PAS domain S-box-containing protein